MAGIDNLSTQLWTVEELTPQRVTGLLQESGALSEGEFVEDMDVGKCMQTGAMGSVHALSLRYAKQTRNTRPFKLVFKRTRSDLEFSDKEVRFYRDLAPRLPIGIAPRCFGSRYCKRSRQYFLLLEDLSESHECRVGSNFLPLRPDHVGMAFDCLALLHASHWQNPREGFDWEEDDPLESVIRAMPMLAKHYPKVRERFGDTISDAEDELYSRYFADGRDALETRLMGRCNFALLHNDPHVGNLLFPRTPTRDRARTVLVDWGGIGMGPATWDLAFHLMWTDAECWSRKTSLGLLTRYHAGLRSTGVTGYSYDQCEDDFRYALLDNLRIPIGLVRAGLVQASGAIPDYILNSHTAAMSLIRAWDCFALLN